MTGGRIASASIAAVLAFAVRASDAAPADSLEYAVKATFVYKFAAFVDWPPAAFGASASPFELCVVGNDPVAQIIDSVAAGQIAGDRPVTVRHLAAVARDSGCHILYVAFNGLPAEEALDAVRSAPVLTITDSVHGGPAHGIISFVVQANRVRFDIDDAAAAESGLSISSKLLSLARAVRPRP